MKCLFITRGKTIFLLLIFILITNKIYPQSFEGVLTYKVKFKTTKYFDSIIKKSNILKKRKSNKLDSINVFFKDNDFKKIIYKKYSSSSIYLDSTKLQYLIDSSNKELTTYKTYTSPTLESKRKYKFIIKYDDSMYLINSIRCKRKVIDYGYFKYILYYSNIYSKNSFEKIITTQGLYTNIEKENFGKNILIVKLIKETKKVTSEIYLSNIYAKKINQNIFIIPRYYEPRKFKKINKESQMFKFYKFK